jgi:hypothetical protein
MNLSLDHPTNALYQRYIAPQLRAGETVLFCARWGAIMFVPIAIFLVLVVGVPTLDSYYDYYIYATLDEACGDAPWGECGKFYEGATLFVPVGGALAILALLMLIVVVLGLHKQLYVITNERVISCRIGFPRGFDAFELKGLTYRRGWFALNIRKGGLELPFFLDRPARDAAEVCLAAAIEGSRK